MDQPVFVTGTPTLSLNDRGTATYAGGSGTSKLVFNYTDAATDMAVAQYSASSRPTPSRGAAPRGF